MVWIDSYERASTDRAGVLCRRHADAMVVPLGWMLDDRRDAVPRLFKAPATQPTANPRHRRAPSSHRNDGEQLQLDADADFDAEAELVDPVADVEIVAEAEVLPWKPAFDQTDDLDGLLEAHSPLLARAFGGQGRTRPAS